MFSSNAKCISKQKARKKYKLLNRVQGCHWNYELEYSYSNHFCFFLFDKIFHSFASTDNVQRIRYFYHVIQKVVSAQDRSRTILCRNSGNFFGSFDI